MTKRIDSRWFVGLTGQEKKDFETFLRNSETIIRRFLEEIEKVEESIHNEEASESSYENVDWPYLQAHRNGKKDALKTLKALCQHIER